MTGKIDADPLRIAATRTSEGARSAKIKRREHASDVSAVAITAAGQSFANLERSVTASSGIDHAKVAATTAAIRDGRYTIDAQHVAEGFLRNEAQWRHAAGLP